MYIISSHYKRNWTAGESLNQTKFHHLEKSIDKRVMQAIQILASSDAYGLLSIDDKAYKSLDIEVEAGEIVIKQLLAITPAGALIEVCEELGGSMRKSLSHLDQTCFYDVFMGINPFEYTPAGKQENISSGNLPQPYLAPSLNITFAEPGNNTNSLHLRIAKIEFVEEEWKLVPYYIPPCNQISAYGLLESFSKECKSTLINISQLAKKIFVKIQDQSEQGILVESIAEFTRQMAYFSGHQLASFKLEFPLLSPLQFFKLFVQLAQTVMTFLDLLPEKDRREFLLYAGKFTQGFEQKTSELAEHKYQHDHIHLSCQAMTFGLKVWLDFLKGVDCEIEIGGSGTSIIEKDVKGLSNFFLNRN